MIIILINLLTFEVKLSVNMFIDHFYFKTNVDPTSDNQPSGVDPLYAKVKCLAYVE